ncbi:NEDD8-specific protease [Acrasis kona]|uniref:NEDD8-specific protease n=1 Tax=Acrasis kona TaxID=1008807 RepID=A0AAW2Z1K6_9EUKA
MTKPSWLDQRYERTFFDSQTLFYDDVIRLRGKEWLNDSIINYYLLYLENVKYEQQKDDLLFLSPSVTFWIMQVKEKEDVADAINPLNPTQKDLIFIPINDNSDETGEVSGGSHWSLVVYNRKEDTFNYYDSSGDYNYGSAVKTVAKIAHFLNPKYDYGTMSIKINKISCSQQQNGYDCGVYLLSFCDVLGNAEHVKNVSPRDINCLREDILKKIQQGVGAT